MTNNKENIKVGSIYQGTVKNIQPYGAFVQILPGIDGLCHISEFQEKRLNTVEEFVNVGDELKVKVLSNKNGRISLSHKQAKD